MQPAGPTSDPVRRPGGAKKNRRSAPQRKKCGPPDVPMGGNGAEKRSVHRFHRWHRFSGAEKSVRAATAKNAKFAKTREEEGPRSTRIGREDG